MSLTPTEFRAVRNAIHMAASDATPAGESRLYAALRKLELEHTGRNLGPADEPAIRKTIARIKEERRVFPLTSDVLDEIGDALVEGRPVRKLPRAKESA